MSVDVIRALKSLGYTEREAAFLYLVAVHSGYFLRRQYDYFIDRQKGAIAARFLEKARRMGHIQVFDSGHGRQIYHLFHRPIYRLIGDPESQNRRTKSDPQVRSRLITLDYILENNQDHYIVSDDQKLNFLRTIRRLDPGLYLDHEGRLTPGIHSTPIALADRQHPSTCLVRFLFIDEGLLTTTKFERFLAELAPLLRAIIWFEVIYIASSDHNFDRVESIFRRQFDNTIPPIQGTLGADWRTEVGPTQAQRWSHLRPHFTTALLDFSYPKVQRNELRGSCERSGSGSTETRASY